MSETNYHNTKFFTENYTYTYLIGDDSEHTNYKNCLKATQLENEINYSPKKDNDIISFVTKENISNS